MRACMRDSVHAYVCMYGMYGMYVWYVWVRGRKEGRKVGRCGACCVLYRAMVAAALFPGREGKSKEWCRSGGGLGALGRT